MCMQKNESIGRISKGTLIIDIDQIKRIERFKLMIFIASCMC